MAQKELPATASPAKFMSIHEACEATGLSRSSIYRKERDKQFPRCVDLGQRRKAFVREEVEQWIESQIAKRDRRAA